MIYLFACRNSSEDIFKGIYHEMVKRGYDCIRIINDESIVAQESIDKLRDKPVVLITSDHLNLRDNGYTILEIINILNPVRRFYASHDLTTPYLIEDEKNYLYKMNFEIFVHGDLWRNIFEPTKCQIYQVGYPRWINNQSTIEYQCVFFMSSIYIYVERSIQDIYNSFQYIFDNNIPIKLPKCLNSLKFINHINSLSPNILDLDLDTFKILLKTNTVITNASSSIIIEAAIAGCNVIHIGTLLNKEYFNEFDNRVYHTKSEPACGFDTSKINIMRIAPMEKYKCDVEKLISIITKE